jgi:glycerate 2-kinase
VGDARSAAPSAGAVDRRRCGSTWTEPWTEPRRLDVDRAVDGAAPARRGTLGRVERLRVVVAPDSFKGSASASQAATALARGWSRVRPDDVVRTVPMADGGEGTLDAFCAAFPGARRIPVTVEGPDGRDVGTHWVLLPDGTGVVELAATSGITLLDRPRPHEAHTRGFGQAIAAALDHGVERLLLGLGGSASTDGGAGALTAMGARLLDADGSPVAAGNQGLGRLATVDLAGLRPVPPGGAVILGDVTSPLLGPSGAAGVFGPQKGATADDVAVLEQNLARFASQVPADPLTPGAGAAGGAGFGLLAWGATIASGSAALGRLLDLPQAVRSADVVITGEGRFDAQSAAGKVPSYVLDTADTAGIPVMLVAGRVDAPTDAFTAAVALTDLAGSAESAVGQAAHWLEVAGTHLAERASRT